MNTSMEVLNEDALALNQAHNTRNRPKVNQSTTLTSLNPLALRE